MSIDRKQPIEVRYKEPWLRLYPIFWFIFLSLEKSQINFDLTHTIKGGKTKLLKKDFDVCVLISLRILKIIANSTDLTNPCTNEELLLIWYLAFDKKLDDSLIRRIDKTRLGELKAPENCKYFYDDENIKKIKSNSFGKYYRTIPKVLITECFKTVWCQYDTDKTHLRIDTRKYFHDSFRNFINGMNLELPEKYKMNRKNANNFAYYNTKFAGRFGYICCRLLEDKRDELQKRIDEIFEAKPKKQVGWKKLEKN